MRGWAGSSRRMLGAGVVVCAAVALVGCRSGSTVADAELAPLDESPIFSSSEYGVPVSPRVTNLKRVPRGGGRDQIGKPYQVRGKWYYPKEEPGYVGRGTASWYGSNFHGRLTANGEVYDMYHLSAAHPTFPLPSYARVTNKANGRSVMVRVNDRGPYAHGRVVDVSQRAAEVLGFRNAGVTDVKVEYLGRAPLEGDDKPMLMASLRQGTPGPSSDGLPTGVMIASNEAAPQTPSLTNTISYSGSAVVPNTRPQATSAINAAVQARAPSSAPVEAEPAPAQAVSAPAGVPLPTRREAVLSYAPNAVQSGAFRALADLVANEPAAMERIEIGEITDVDLLLRVHALADTAGELVSDGANASLALLVEPGADADAALHSLWAAGATDAFVLRD